MDHASDYSFGNASTQSLSFRIWVSLGFGFAFGEITPCSGTIMAETSIVPESIPLVHITDLYHPPQDPDDQFDLATILALPEFDLRAVILDQTRKFLIGAPEGWDIPRDPGLVTVTQASALIGRAIPVALGPRDPLRNAEDDARDQPLEEQSGINLLLSVLRHTSVPVVVSVVGSARVLAAAYRREPELVRNRVAKVLLNAGSTSDGELEWNVMLDPFAFVELWKSGLPIDWYPCATANGAFDPRPDRGTHWKASHAALLSELSPCWRGWFAYGLSGSARGDILRSLDELGKGAGWEQLLAGSRCMWSTASLVMAAGRVLVRTGEGWRFVESHVAQSRGEEIWPWRLDPIAAQVRSNGIVEWSGVDGESVNRLFGRRSGADYGDAMAEALAALLGTLGK